MLDPIFSTLSYNSLGTVATITDSTVYGGANPLRDDVAVYIEGWKLDKNAVTTALTISNSNPVVTTQWTFDSSVDGWYRFRMYIFNVYSSVTYNLNDVVYSISPTGLYKSLQNSNTDNAVTDTNFWTPVTLPNTVITGNNVVAEYKDYIVVEKGKSCAGNAVGNWADATDCGACDKLDLMAKWLQRHAFVTAIQRFELISQFSKAEELARKLENLCKTC